MTQYYNRKSTTSRRRELRNNLTKAEVLLWSVLKGRQLEGFKFRRQFSIGKYHIDFFCTELNFGIEVDGETHFTPKGRTHDSRRKDFLDSLSIQIVRVNNPDVYDNLAGVWEMLRKAVQERKTSQTKKPQAPVAPPLTKGGQGGLDAHLAPASATNLSRQIESTPKFYTTDLVTPPTPPS